jgi:hypothetical protein
MIVKEAPGKEKEEKKRETGASFAFRHFRPGLAQCPGMPIYTFGGIQASRCLR